MKFLKYFAITILLLLIGGTIIYKIRKAYVVEKDYFPKLGLVGSHYLSDIIESKGQPIKKEIISLDDLYYTNLEYDGYVYSSMFYQDKESDPNAILRITHITDPNYRIGKKMVGIGTSKKEIEKTYNLSQKISDLANNNDIGYIDNHIWVVFQFSNDNKVNQISIYYGP